VFHGGSFFVFITTTSKFLDDDYGNGKWETTFKYPKTCLASSTPFQPKGELKICHSAWSVAKRNGSAESMGLMFSLPTPHRVPFWGTTLSLKGRGESN
jgi:hypothetical protein